MMFEGTVFVSRLWAVVLYSGLAAACAALGVLPFMARRRLPSAWLGWADALAAGLMLGASYILVVEGIERLPLAETFGTLAGIATLYATHALTGIWKPGLRPARPDGSGPTDKLWLRNAIHSSAEGVSIGAAMAVDLDFGIFVALALTAHNVPEATALCAYLVPRGVRLLPAALLCVAANLGQIVLAVLTFLMVAEQPALLPAALGFAAGALIYLVVVELLPDSFAKTGHTTIAVLTSVALGAVVIFRGMI
ncbi:MAG: ZIP family metal transporter [Acidobacteria bacterium]|nr:ZIP family metal transporter [Acidobacteriota bacterium]